MSTFFVKTVDGKRDPSRRTTDQYGGTGLAGCQAMCKPGETVDGPRNCQYAGCPCDATARGPCALCYE